MKIFYAIKSFILGSSWIFMLVFQMTKSRSDRVIISNLIRQYVDDIKSYVF